MSELPEPVSLDVFTGTCDWGGCHAETVGYRHDERDWRSVCRAHFDAAPPALRREMYENRLAALRALGEGEPIVDRHHRCDDSACDCECCHGCGERMEETR